MSSPRRSGPCHRLVPGGRAVLRGGSVASHARGLRPRALAALRRRRLTGAQRRREELAAAAAWRSRSGARPAAWTACRRSLARHARHADLTMVGPGPTHRARCRRGAAGRGRVHGHRPPGPGGPGGQHPRPCRPSRALIAWDGSREAARAVGDALPLLRPAEAVMVLVVGATRRSRQFQRPAWALPLPIPARRQGAGEARHQAGMAVPDTILAQVTDDGPTCW